jgi:nucleotide-binding universal stress UspA family protein
MTLPGNILVCTDLSEASDAALRDGLRWGECFGATVHILHVEVPPVGSNAADFSVSASGELHHRTFSALDAALARAEVGQARLGERWVRLGDPRRTILAAAAQLDAELIVVGSHGRTGARRVLLGSVAEALVHDADRPLLLARNPAPGRTVAAASVRSPLHSLLIGVDLLPASEQALRYGVALAEAAGAKAHVLHVYAPLLVPPSAYTELSPHDDLHRTLLKQLGALTSDYEQSPALGKCIAASGNPRWTIVDTAEQLASDLIVLGWNPPSLAQLVLGEVHGAVMRRAPCSVLVVKPRRV